VSRIGAAGRPFGVVGALAAGGLVAACQGPQSALDPAGESAERIAGLWWGMAIAGVLIWAVVVALMLYAARERSEPVALHAGQRLVFVGGAIIPTVILTGLLAIQLPMLPGILAPGPPDGLRIEIVGEQWWWRVRYRVPGREPLETANEVRLPVGRRVDLVLSSPDVIHSFWVPPLAGKMDLTPGRTTRLPVRATRAGVFRGACAEYCGASHALMRIVVIAMEPDAFEAWLEAERGPAGEPAGPEAARGAELVQSRGCFACHTIRGTAARGTVGPDLTHVGGRHSLAAGVLPNELSAFVGWIAGADRIKPGARMPSFGGALPAADIAAIAAYLDGLR
jgi:cytochrome c oxidase subunit 2